MLIPTHLPSIFAPSSNKVVIAFGCFLIMFSRLRSPWSLDDAGFTPLDQAALNGEAEMAQALLERGTKIRLPAAVALQKSRDIEKLLTKDPDSLKPAGRVPA